MNAHPPPGGDPEADHRVVLPESSSLIVLLILFGIIALITMVSILAGGRERMTEHTAATLAYGPEDFPDVNFDEPLLPDINDSRGSDRPGVFLVPPPPFSNEDIFPCSGCHADMEPNLERRELTDFHDDIRLDHGPRDRWCFDCHNPDDRDRLRLINGTLIGFDESYRLCGQCHGTIFRDWRQGIHGRRRGYWNGAKSYLLCAHCHNPHAPHFAPIKPLPPPVEPMFLRQAAETGEPDE
jgi:hypothetical protein